MLLIFQFDIFKIDTYLEQKKINLSKNLKMKIENTYYIGVKYKSI